MAGIDISGLRDEIVKIVQTKVQKAASKIADELTQEARNAISDFYNHYPNPVLYKRQGGLNSSYKRFYRNPHGTVYRGGVELMPGSGSYHSCISREAVGSDFVSALAIFNGEHGNVQALPYSVNTIPPVMSPSPYEKIEEKRNAILMNIYDYLN